ncbi:hypothetical protein PIB30_054943 [Stylosanthes scabra]|uniref:NIF system FeS cluster assembly NifU N-terminal domain-containing protein n=1 Tax=Stylosanthes scabra TaxID=79078 RepID=A0ABU6ZHQ0_9FABA|nr:hypothetical protein [Stylosanthes scabra]
MSCRCFSSLASSPIAASIFRRASVAVLQDSITQSLLVLLLRISHKGKILTMNSPFCRVFSLMTSYSIVNPFGLSALHHLSLPPVKLHCSMLSEDAIKAAVKDYESKRAAANGNGKAST